MWFGRLWDGGVWIACLLWNPHELDSFHASVIQSKGSSLEGGYDTLCYLLLSYLTISFGISPDLALVA